MDKKLKTCRMANNGTNIVRITFHNEKLKKEFLLWVNNTMENLYKGFPENEFPPKLLADLHEDDMGFGYIDLDGNVLQYETRWRPNTYTLLRVAEAYEFDFTNEFEEISSLIYGEGRFIYSKRIYEEKLVEESDWQELIDSDSTEMYVTLDELLADADWEENEDYYQ